MKKVLSIGYWGAAIVIVAAVMLSFKYRVPEAFFIGTLFLPGAVAAKFAFSKFASGSKKEKVKTAIFATAGILVGEILLMFVAHYTINILRAGPQDYYNWPSVPDVLQNPVFLAIMVAALAVGSVYVDGLLEKKFPSGPKTITYLSERHPVTVEIQNIKFVESNDSVTIVHTSDGAEHKNKTPISQWEAILGEDFLRIHRSFLVNRNAITAKENDTVTLGDIELPVSRKYKARLNAIK